LDPLNDAAPPQGPVQVQLMLQFVINPANNQTQLMGMNMPQAPEIDANAIHEAIRLCNVAGAQLSDEETKKRLMGVQVASTIPQGLVIKP
jgi:hypothetical protein